MKKVLFATTALIATAGMAAADVRISGYGRFGLDYNEASAGNKTTLTSRLRLQFDATTETDGGVAFGARIRMQAENRDGLPNNQIGALVPVLGGGWDNGFSGARFYVSTGGFTLGVGNIIGAMEATPGLYLPTSSAGIGIDGAGYNSLATNMAGNSFDWDAFSSDGAGVNGVEVMYRAGAFSGHLSYSSADACLSAGNAAAINAAAGAGTVVPGCVAGEENFALNVAYTFGDWTVAAAYNDEKDVGVGADNDLMLLTVQGNLGVARVKVAYATMDNTAAVGGDSSKISIAGAFDLGAATTLVAFVANEDSPGLAQDGTSFGINVSHDLGGGVTLDGGLVESSTDNTTVQLGAYFRF